MKQRVIVAAIFVPALFVVLFFLPAYALAAVVALICAIAAYELLHAISATDNERISIYATFSAAIIPVGVYLKKSEIVFIAAVFILLCVMFFEAIVAYKTRREIPFSQILIVIFGGAVIPYMLSGLISLKMMTEGRLFVLIPVLSAFITDAGAYFTGVLFGKRRAVPNVSPNKTVEGYIGGIAAGVAAMLIYGVIIELVAWQEVRFWALLMYGLIGSAVTELGDLAFSLIKREYGVKDFGSLLPGHGGMLDRFDSMVFTAPAAYLLVEAIPAIII